MDPLFEVHMLNDDGISKAKQIAEAFDNLLLKLGDTCLLGREMSIVKTHLETACFFAKKSMANDVQNQK